MAGVAAVEVAAVLKQHAAVKEATFMAGSVGGTAPLVDTEMILPPGTYYGRTHLTSVKIVDGIYVPAEGRKAMPEESAVATSLEWLRGHGAWGLRAAERLGPDNDFLPDLELFDESRGGRADKIGPEGAAHIACALATNDVVMRLDLGNNALEEEGAASLCQALRTSNRTLIELNLSGNSLGDAGVRHVASMLQANTTLTSLDVRENDIAAEETRELLRAAWGGRDPAMLRLD